MSKIEKFLMHAPSDQKRLVAEISQKYPIKMESPKRTQLTYYDTFDWALYNSGRSVRSSATEYFLISLQDDRIIDRTEWKSRKRPKFWWDFQQISFREELKRFIEVRALLPRCRLKRETQAVRILDDRQKTVLRLNVEKLQVANARQKDSSIQVVTLAPVRGYTRYPKEVGQFLREFGSKREPIEIFQTILKAAGEQPGGYSSKLNVRLQLEMTAKQATTLILKDLLRTMRQNEAGIEADIDTEFLHDFRVAIRRTRSALTQIKSIFSNETVRRFKQDFAAVGKSTNRLRDLDVYLLNREVYGAMLPDELRPSLDPLFRFLLTERTKHRSKLVRALNGTFYKKLLYEWDALLNKAEEGSHNEAKNANRPAVAVARELITKQHDRVMNLGNSISDSTADAELHKLRLECKKLRYLLEFFASLFPSNEMALLIRELKALQDNLGAFNDLCVQRQELRDFVDRLIPPEKEYFETAAAIGGLISSLYQKQMQVRMGFSQKFLEFRQPGKVKLYRQLFS